MGLLRMRLSLLLVYFFFNWVASDRDYSCLHLQPPQQTSLARGNFDNAKEASGFTEKNISSICSRYGSKNRRNLLKETKEILNSSATELHQLMEKTGLKPSNIASILSRSGARVAEGIEALTSKESIQGLQELIGTKDAPGILTADNVSSMLSGSGARVAEGIEALTSEESIQGLQRLTGTKDAPGILTADNISSILNGSGSRVAERIETLTSEESIQGLQRLIGTDRKSTRLNSSH